MQFLAYKFIMINRKMVTNNRILSYANLFISGRRELE